MSDDAAFQTVEKIEAAQRQAAQAIRLFFGRGDEVAIHTLAAAAYQILSDLCAHAGIKRELEDSEILEEMGAKKEVLAALRKPQNFFKHADKDPKATVRFSPFLSVGLLVYCASYYTQLTQRSMKMYILPSFMSLFSVSKTVYSILHRILTHLFQICPII